MSPREDVVRCGAAAEVGSEDAREPSLIDCAFCMSFSTDLQRTSSMTKPASFGKASSATFQALSVSAPLPCPQSSARTIAKAYHLTQANQLQGTRLGSVNFKSERSRTSVATSRTLKSLTGGGPALKSRCMGRRSRRRIVMIMSWPTKLINR